MGYLFIILIYGHIWEVGWSATFNCKILGRAVPATHLQQLRRVMDNQFRAPFNNSSHPAWGESILHRTSCPLRSPTVASYHIVGLGRLRLTHPKNLTWLIFSTLIHHIFLVIPNLISSGYRPAGVDVSFEASQVGGGCRGWASFCVSSCWGWASFCCGWAYSCWSPSEVLSVRTSLARLGQQDYGLQQRETMLLKAFVGQKVPMKSAWLELELWVQQDIHLQEQDCNISSDPMSQMKRPEHIVEDIMLLDGFVWK